MNSRRGATVCNQRRARITLGENNPVYSIPIYFTSITDLQQPEESDDPEEEEDDDDDGHSIVIFTVHSGEGEADDDVQHTQRDDDQTQLVPAGPDVLLSLDKNLLKNQLYSQSVHM